MKGFQQVMTLIVAGAIVLTLVSPESQTANITTAGGKAFQSWLTAITPRK